MDVAGVVVIVIKVLKPGSPSFVIDELLIEQY